MAYNDELYKTYLKKAEKEKALREGLERQRRQNDERGKELSKEEREISRKLSRQNWKGDLARNPEYAKNLKERQANSDKAGELADRKRMHSILEDKWKRLAAKEKAKRTDLAKKVSEPKKKMINAVGKSLKGKTR